MSAPRGVGKLLCGVDNFIVWWGVVDKLLVSCLRTPLVWITLLCGGGVWISCLHSPLLVLVFHIPNYGYPLMYPTNIVINISS